MIIYKTINKINEKLYIGQQSDEINKPYYIGSGKILKQAIKKYGRKNFEKVILEKCASKEELNKREVYWIKKLNTTNNKIGYNITSGGCGGNTISNLSIKDKRKWKQNLKKASKRNGERKLSGNFTKAEIEGFKKISESKIGDRNYRWKGYIYIYDENMNLINKFDTIKKASKELHIHKRIINKLANTNILYKRFHKKNHLNNIDNCFIIINKN